MEGLQVQAGSSSGWPQPTPTRQKRERSPGDHRDQVSATQEQLDEEREATPATQELDEHFVTFRSDVVGVQYYRGMVGKGEYVMLRRQPENAYDRNAVQVVNSSGHQVGHIPRGVAANLAGYMDEQLIAVEGRMIGQNLDMAKHFKLALDVSVYAKPSHMAALDSAFQWAKRAAAARQPKPETKAKGKGRALGGDTGVRGAGAGSGVGLPMDAGLSNILEGLQKAEHDDKQSDRVMDSLTKDKDVSALPLHPAPPGIANGDLVVDILPHQSQALQWMIERENPKLPTSATEDVQFWTLQTGQGGKGNYWLNVATKTPQQETPNLGRGGIIADGMGLGKTLTTLSLVLATKQDKTADSYSNATLIVCPLSVLSNWEKQIQEHVAPGHLSFYTYHGASRGVTAATLAQYDVVLTTYQTVTADLSGAIPAKDKKVKTTIGPLGKVKWKRIVADEGHVLKNPKAKMTLSFAALSAERRWVCTGTPIVNSPADLGSLLTCIQVCNPLDRADYFKALLLRPLKSSDPAASGEAAKLLQALVGQILLRRTKESKDASGKKLVDLPPIEFYKCQIPLDDETRETYDLVLKASKARFLQSVENGQGAANVLSMLTRLRQLCLSAELVPQSFIEDMRAPPMVNAQDDKPAVAVKNISPEARAELIDKLKQALADSEECPICFCELERQNEPRITDCGHAACLPCISAWLVKSTSCPQCRHTINMTSLLDLPPDADDTVDMNVDTTKRIKSAKIDEIVKYLKAFPVDEKTLVFSQFTTFLGHVGKRLEDEGIEYVRFDGSMNAKKRQQVIADFQRPAVVKNGKTSGARVMLISLKSGAVGLNLTAASNVFLCDPWWQSAIEAQAIDRVHRMGQRKPVRVFQLIAADTVESKVLEIQTRKDDLVAKAFEKTSKETKRDKREARFEDIKALFGI